METLYSSLTRLFLFFDRIRIHLLLHVDQRTLEVLKFVLLGLFALAFLVQLYFYLFVFRKTGAYRKSDTVSDTPAATVIVCARNEDDNLSKFLPLLFQQDYPDYEVVVVNDCSYDHTADILEEFSKKQPRLKVVTIKEDENYRHGKKFALLCGIKGASHEHLVFTDADCYPAGPGWLKAILSNYSSEKTEIVLGYGAYEKNKGILNKLIRFDAFCIALNYLSLSLSGKTYMGVGRNLSYRKSLFFKHKGFGSHYFLESGDDDLFVNQAATAENVKAELSAESITYSSPKYSFGDWFNQKRRHLTTYGFYKKDSKRRLFFITGSQYAFWILFSVCLFARPYTVFVLAAFLLRLLCQLFIFRKAMNRLGEKDLLLFSPVFELCLLFIYPVIQFSNTALKQNKWKS